MIKRFLFFIFLLPLSCANLPDILPPDASFPDAGEIRERCQGTFIREPLRMLHNMEATAPGGRKQFMTGLTLISPDTEQFRSVMMSIEGLVIFDGIYDKGSIDIRRGIPPFDSENFARGVLEDVRLMFLGPKGECRETGMSESGMPVCRYEEGEDIIIDVEILPDGSRIIRQYVGQYIGKKLRRTVRTTLGRTAVPEESELIFHGSLGYKLHLELLESEGIAEEEFQNILENQERL